MLKGLYVITDETLTPLDSMINQVKLSLEGGAKIVQFRYKQKITDEVLKKIFELKEVVKSFDKVFIINDYVDLALEVDADGVHVGEFDESDFEKIKAKMQNKIIGVSCYGDINRALQMQKMGVSYVAFGSFFASPTKPHSKIVPVEIVKIAKELLEIPVCVIGGITTQNVDILLSQGADMVSVISDIWSGDIKQQSQIFSSKF